MARRRAAGDDTRVISIDPETGEPVGPVDDGGGDAGLGDTNAGRRTADNYFRMLGSDEVGEGYITVHHISADGTETRILKAPADKWTYDDLVEHIRLEHAPAIHPGKRGDYRIRLYVKAPSGRHTLQGNTLEGVLAPAAPDTGSRGLSLTPTGTDPALVALLQRQQEESRLMREAIEQLKADRGGIDVVGIISVATPIVLPLLTAWLTRPKDDPMKALQTALALTGTIKDMRDPVPEVEPPPFWVEPVMKLAEGIPQLLAARTLAAPGAAPPAGAPAGGQPQHPLFAHLTRIAQAAEQDADPAEVARVLWEGIPEAMRPAVMQQLTDKAYMARLAAIQPAVLNDPEFWVDLREALLDLAQVVHTEAPAPQAGQQNAAGQGHVSDNTAGG